MGAIFGWTWIPNDEHPSNPRHLTPAHVAVVVTPLEVAGALVIGASLGLLGGGGSILTVPVFVYAAGLDPKVAVAASLPVVALTSASGALAHYLKGNVQVRTAFIYGATAAVGSFAGARMASFLSGTTQLILLAVVMLAAAFRMSLGKALSESVAPDRAIAFSTLIPVAVVVGALTGIVGVGGGFLIVPTLVIICHLPMRTAVGTSLMVIAMNAASGTAGYAGQVPIPWPIVLVFSSVALLGRYWPVVSVRGCRRLRCAKDSVCCWLAWRY